ncbi:RDD family protein [Vibrio vulnificus]
MGRYFAYYISFLPLGLGVIWIVFDSKKRSWHDKLANTVVIRDDRL